MLFPNCFPYSLFSTRCKVFLAFPSSFCSYINYCFLSVILSLTRLHFWRKNDTSFCATTVKQAIKKECFMVKTCFNINLFLNNFQKFYFHGEGKPWTELFRSIIIIMALTVNLLFTCPAEYNPSDRCTEDFKCSIFNNVFLTVNISLCFSHEARI